MLKSIRQSPLKLGIIIIVLVLIAFSPMGSSQNSVKLEPNQATFSAGFTVESDDFQVKMFQIGPNAIASETYTPVDNNIYNIVSQDAITNINFFSCNSFIILFTLFFKELLLDPSDTCLYISDMFLT